jgi:hypothetical protein
MTVNAFPLAWPQGFPRAKAREKGAFKTTLAGALANVQDSLRRFGVDSNKKLDGLVISSNVTLGVSRPEDPGVSVWFTWDGLGVAIAVDRYASVESNLQAIHHIIEARRTELRHGTLALVRATFQGFLALPAPSGKAWHEVLMVPKDVPRADLDAAYKRERSKAHPDKGGSAERFDEVERAYREATT